jgi:hypothetical protein
MALYLIGDCPYLFAAFWAALLCHSSNRLTSHQQRYPYIIDKLFVNDSTSIRLVQKMDLFLWDSGAHLICCLDSVISPGPNTKPSRPRGAPTRQETERLPTLRAEQAAPSRGVGLRRWLATNECRIRSVPAATNHAEGRG